MSGPKRGPKIRQLKVMINVPQGLKIPGVYLDPHD